MTSRFQPYREPLRVTLLRTVTIALVVGAVLARLWGGTGHGGPGGHGGAGWLARWPVATLIALWPALGGHFVELWFLNWLRPRIWSERIVQVSARVLVWFIGGAGLALGMGLTRMALVASRPGQYNSWGRVGWIGGLGFIGIELVVHLVLQLRGRPSFYDGRG